MSLVNNITRFFKGISDSRGCSAVIAAAGSSQRMEGEDKLLFEIGGKPVLIHTLLAFQNCGCVNEVIVVVRAEHLEKIVELCRLYGIDKASKVMAGGGTRLESVMNGVFAVSDGSGFIAIHDGARPCVESSVIEKTLAAAEKFHAAAPAIPVIPTLKRVDRKVIVETVDREGLFEIQTPQIFDAGLIKAALTKASKMAIDITDDCMAAELIGTPVHITEGSASNIKITTKCDLMIAEAIIKSQWKVESGKLKMENV